MLLLTCFFYDIIIILLCSSVACRDDSLYLTTQSYARWTYILLCIRGILFLPHLYKVLDFETVGSKIRGDVAHKRSISPHFQTMNEIKCCISSIIRKVFFIVEEWVFSFSCSFARQNTPRRLDDLRKSKEVAGQNSNKSNLCCNSIRRPSQTSTFVKSGESALFQINKLP